MAEQPPTPEQQPNIKDWFDRQSQGGKVLIVGAIIVVALFVIGAVGADTEPTNVATPVPTPTATVTERITERVEVPAPVAPAPAPQPRAKTVTYPNTITFCQKMNDALLSGSPQRLIAVGEWGKARMDTIHPEVRLAASEVFGAVGDTLNGDTPSDSELKRIGGEFGVACVEQGWIPNTA